MKTGLSTALICLLPLMTSCVVLDLEPQVGDEEGVLRPNPHFPTSDVSRGNEGWVLVAYKVNSGGFVVEPYIAASSGRSTFDHAALSTIEKWRYAPGEERHTSVLVSFEFEHKTIRISKGFRDLYLDVHELIDAGDFDEAEADLERWREGTHSPYEIAFIYLAWARIAGYRGDLDLQLQYYRQAMLKEGRWLASNNYQECLRASIMLAIMLEDYASAVRDYELLTRSGAAKERYAHLEDSINTARTVLERQQGAAEPHSIAHNTVAVTTGRKQIPPLRMSEAPRSRPGLSPPERRSSSGNR